MHRRTTTIFRFYTSLFENYSILEQSRGSVTTFSTCFVALSIPGLSLTKSRKSSRWNARRLNILTRGCASTEMYQEHQVHRDINGSYASIDLSRDFADQRCWPASQLPIISHSVCCRFTLVERNAFPKYEIYNSRKTFYGKISRKVLINCFLTFNIE